MLQANFEQNQWISAAELAGRVGTTQAPTVIDVRRPPAIADSGRVIAGARWRQHTDVSLWASELNQDEDVVVYCVHGHNVSQSAAAVLRSLGFRARALEHGIDGYAQVGGVTSIWRADFHDTPQPGYWVTRGQPKIDRIACCWLIRRFIDPDARILFVEPDQVIAVAEEFAATAFDVEGVPLSHDNDNCSFDTLLRHFDLRSPALDIVARIVRGADTAKLDLAPQCAGLLALSLGVSSLHEDDLAAMEHGLLIYDALYAWACHAPDESHGWPASAAPKPPTA